MLLNCIYFAFLDQIIFRYHSVALSVLSVAVTGDVSYYQVDFDKIEKQLILQTVRKFALSCYSSKGTRKTCTEYLCVRMSINPEKRMDT